jgi:hypothetical protein
MIPCRCIALPLQVSRQLKAKQYSPDRAPCQRCAARKAHAHELARHSPAVQKSVLDRKVESLYY